MDGEFLFNLFKSQNGLCAYTSIPLKIKNPKRYEVLSLDRIDSKKGYTKDNVVWVCNAVNMFKSDMELEMFEKFLKMIFIKKKTESVFKVKKLTETARLPIKFNPNDAGYDIFIDRIEDHGTFIKVFSGIAVQPDPRFFMFLTSRSSTYKKGLMIYNDIGTIDNNYTGEIIGVFYKTEDFKELPKIGDRLLQLILIEQHYSKPVFVDELSSTERGEKGFGSSSNKK